MKIPRITHPGVRLGRAAVRQYTALFASAFLAVGAMSAHADLADGLVGNWSFDGDLNDSAGGNLPGGPANGVGKTWSVGGVQDNPEALADNELTEASYVDGKIGQSVKFADSFYVETPLEDELVERFNFGAPDDPTGFTISAWVTVDQFSKNWQCAVAKGEQNQWRLHRRGGESTITGNGGAGDTPTGEQALDDGEWHHVVLRSDIPNDKHSMWVNGQLDGGAEAEGISPEGNIMPMMIGQNPDTADRTWEGNIDEVAIWNRALTDEEVIQLYNGGDGLSMGKAAEIVLDFNSDPEGTFQVVNNGGEPAEWRATGGVDDSGYFSVTDALNGTYNVLIFDDVTEGLALRGFDFTVDLRVGGGTDRPADGFSLNLVTPEDPLLQDPIGTGFAGTRDLGAGEDNLPEEGSQTGLGVGLDAWTSGGSDVVGISIRVDGVLITQVEAPTLNGEPDDATSLQTGPQNLDDPDDPTGLLEWKQFRAFLDAETSEMTIQWKGETLMDKEVVPWTPTSVRPIFAARTGGANQNHHIDNFRLVMVPARLASMGARIKGNDLVITGTNGPESAYEHASLVVTLDLDGDGTQETIDVGEGVVDGNRRIYTYTPPASFFEPETSHAYKVVGADSLGNVLGSEGVWEVAPTNIFAGGFFTTTHVWDPGITDAATVVDAVENGAADGNITVRHPYAHFHDNAGAPIQGELSGPYPLWAEPDFISDENILDGERLGGGLGDRNNFGIVTEGEFFVRKGGNILFVCNSDDGFTLEIDGELIGEAGDRGRGNTVMEKQLEAGTHQMRFVHWENGGGAGVSVYIARAPGGTIDDATVNKDNFEILSGFNIHDVSTEDTDNDGMDDFKENFFFGDLSKDGTGDNDSDGLNDAQELALRADPTVKDTDGDGLEDGPEANDLGTSPSNVDSDGDGLADGQEVNDLKTDPTKQDTDGDTFADNVELALGNDPLAAGNKPDAIIAVTNGVWSDGATWSDGQAPSAGKNYVAVGNVTGKLSSAGGAFGGDSLTLIGPGMTLNLDHAGPALGNITLNNSDINVNGSVGLGGTLNIRGAVNINVGSNDLALSSVLSGGGSLTFVGGSAEDFQGNVELSGAGSTHGGPVNIIGTDVAGLSEGSLGTGSMLLAGGGAAFGYDYDSDLALLKIQGDNFRIVLGGTSKVADIVGVDADGNLLFSLNELAGPGPYSADDLLGAFQLDEGISGEGTIELLGTGADTDGDGLRDSFEEDNLGGLAATPDGDPDGDGISNLGEQSGGTDPNVADIIVVEPVGPEDVTSPDDAIVLVDGENDGDGNDGPPPGAEGVENVINNIGQKYLHFLDLGSGFVVTPAAGATTISGIRFYPANDAPERDPASFILEGSPTGADGPWQLLAGGSLDLPETRNAGGDLAIEPTLPSQTEFFVNSDAWLSYRVTFPTLRDAEAANSMQIAEVELLGDVGGTLGEVFDANAALVVHYDFNEGSGTAIGNAGSGPEGTLTNAHAGAWVASGSPDGSGYLNFNQDGDTSADSQHVATGLTAPEIPVSGEVDYTMMAWVRADTTAPGGDSQDNMIFGQLSNDNVLHNGIRGAAYHVGHWGNDITVGTVVVDEWHHVAWKYEGGVQSILVDGVPVGSDTKGGLAVESEVVIGATRGDQDRDFSGDLDDVRIYAAALPDNLIAVIASQGSDPGPGEGPDPGPGPDEIGAVTKTAAGVGLSFPAGTTYNVEYSTDLVTWTEIDAGVTGQYEDADAGRNAAGEGFYRGVAQ